MIINLSNFGLRQRPLILSMAATRIDKEGSIKKFASIMSDIKNGKFRPVYLLMGDEPYYTDMILSALDKHVLSSEARDFNYTLIYGSDTDAGQIVSLCRRYPVESPRQLIIVKEAQQLSSLEPLEMYLNSPVKETVLALAFTNKSVDKRSGFYKKAKGAAEILETYALDEWKISSWIIDYVKNSGYEIDQDAAQLMGQYTGTSLRKITLEIDKLFKCIDGKRITVKDIEVNVGISREFNAFELCKAIGEKDRRKSFSIAEVFGDNPKKFPIQMTLGAMFYYFNQLLKAEAVQVRDKVPFFQAAQQCGMFGFREKEYENAARNFPLIKTMAVVAYIKDCDLKSKSAGGGISPDGALLNELLAKILI